MQFKITTSQVLKVLYILSWIIFIGLSIEAGGFIFNAVFTILFKPEATKHLWQQVDLSNLLHYDTGQFIVVVIFICIIALLKAIMFYIIVKILHDKKLSLAQPFNNDVRRFIINLSCSAITIGIFAYWGAQYSKWLVTQGLTMPSSEELRFSGADIWLFMGVILLVIAQIFKKGIEIQSENELTV